MTDTRVKQGWQWVKTAFAVTALAGFLLFAGAPGAKAADWDDGNYQRQVDYTAWRAHEAAEHFGYYSSEARYWRHENHEARERAERHRRHEWREHHHRGYYDYDRDRY